MVNIVKFAQFYCIYLLSSEQMSAGEKQIRCFYKKTIYSMVVLPSGIGTLYTVRIFGGLQAAGISRIISCFFYANICKISSEGIIPPSRDS